MLTTTGGAFSFIVAPGVLTTYQASWKGALATPTTVQVMPRLVLGRSNGWVVHVYANRPFAGRSVQFQRLNPSTGQWVTLRKVQLDKHSTARFQLKLPAGREQAAADHVGQPGGRGLPGGDRPDGHVAAAVSESGRHPPRSSYLRPTSSQLTTSHHAAR